jgi:oligosaccharide repeat unit polymerase
MSPALDLLSSAWVPVFLLFGLTLYCRTRVGSWLVPSAFFGMYWFCFVVASLLAVDHRVPGLGMWALVSLIIAVQLGSMMGETYGEQTEEEKPHGEKTPGDQSQAAPAEKVQLEQFTRLRVLPACALLTLGAIAALIYFALYSLNLFHQSFSFIALVQMAAKWTFLRYDGFIDPWPLRLAAIWVYPPALLGGILFALSRSFRDKSIAIASLLPGLLLTVLSGGRAAFLVAGVCWLGGCWSARGYRPETRRGFLNLKSGLLLGAGAMALLGLYAGVNSLRGAKDASDARDLSLEFNSGQIRNYMFGMPAAFAEWFDREQQDSAKWGALTFAGPYALLGIRQRTLGTYTDSAPTVGLEGTNIFTIFRGLVQDFTLAGAFLISGLWGFLGGRNYCQRSLRPGTMLGLSAFYAVALFSPLICLFSFNSPIVAWVVTWSVLRSRNGIAIRFHSER